MKMDFPQEWFSAWFDSPYYHLLYFHHDDADAKGFIDALIRHIALPTDAHILDLACGRGRHAIYLNKKGYHVTGIDLSPKSIAIARKFENEKLHFDTHDMREPLPLAEYDLILNLFTSFGYFNTDAEHIRALSHISRALKPGGSFVLDYMNAEKVSKNLVHRNSTVINGVTFQLERRLRGGFIEKDIRFVADDGNEYFFQERVRSFKLEELRELIEKAGMQVHAQWGSYELDEFNRDESDRLIFYCKN